MSFCAHILVPTIQTDMCNMSWMQVAGQQKYITDTLNGMVVLMTVMEKKKETKRGFRVPRIIHPWIPWKLVHTHKYTFLCRQYEPICTTYREFKLPAVILKSSAKKKKITNNLNDMVVLMTAVEKKKTKPGFRVPRITHPSIPEKIVHTHKWGNVFLCTRSCADNTNRFVQHVVNANCWL